MRLEGGRVYEILEKMIAPIVIALAAVMTGVLSRIEEKRGGKSSAR